VDAQPEVVSVERRERTGLDLRAHLEMRGEDRRRFACGGLQLLDHHLGQDHRPAAFHRGGPGELKQGPHQDHKL
jgi:hypothetical protein